LEDGVAVETDFPGLVTHRLTLIIMHVLLLPDLPSIQAEAVRQLLTMNVEGWEAMAARGLSPSDMNIPLDHRDQFEREDRETTAPRTPPQPHRSTGHTSPTASDEGEEDHKDGAGSGSEGAARPSGYNPQSYEENHVPAKGGAIAHDRVTVCEHILAVVRFCVMRARLICCDTWVSMRLSGYA
jgi:hypothetical protein